MNTLLEKKPRADVDEDILAEHLDAGLAMDESGYSALAEHEKFMPFQSDLAPDERVEPGGSLPIHPPDEIMDTSGDGVTGP